MKYKLILLLIIAMYYTVDSSAQHVRVQMSFPVGVAINAPGPAPFAGAVWIGPEWRWKRNAYVCVPGYWAKPRHRHRYWKQGHWKYTRRGYLWIPGKWR